MSRTNPFRWFVRLSAVLAIALALPLLSPAASSDGGPSDELVREALDTISLIIGRDLSADDRAWLRQHWMAEAGDQPEPTVWGLERIAVARQGIEAGTDPLALAELRAQVIDGSYCATRRTSDPATRRMRSILAPDDVVLAADCIVGAVVTRFDVAALARSNGVVGDLVGSPVDVPAIETETIDALSGNFDDQDPEGWQRLLWGELRAAALNELWSSVDQATLEQWKASAKESFKSSNHVGSTALFLEKAALREIGTVKTIAKSGDHRFRSSEVNAFLDYLTFITGAHPSPGERADLIDMLVADFHENPEETIEHARSARRWLDEGYHFGKDPESGSMRSWSAEEQVRMRDEQAARLFCFNDKPDDPEGLRLIEILYAHDQVVDVDCASNRMTRAGDEVLADHGGKPFTRAALDAHWRAFEVIFAVRFSADERRWFDEASINDRRRGAPGLTQAVDEFQRVIAEIQAPAEVGPHVNEQRREGYAIRVYCLNKFTDDPDTARLFKTINDHDPILYEDCERQVIVRESDVNGLIATLNFVGSLGGFEPLTEDEIAAWPDKLKPYFDKRESGPFGYRSIFAKLSYWWFHMPVEARYRTAEALKEEVTSRDGGVDGYVPGLSEKASQQTASLALCDYQKEKLAYNTFKARMTSRAIFNPSPHAAIPWANPNVFDNDAALYGIMAPLVEEFCAKVWN